MRIVVAMMALALAQPAFSAASAPVPPCGIESPVPEPSASAATPSVAVWTKLDWSPPPCLPWSRGQFRFVAAVSGPLALADPDELLARLGAISKTTGLRYWSVTEQASKVLIEEAFAVDASDGKRQRADFTSADMRAGASLYFHEKDNRSDVAATYRMRVLKATDDEITVESTNVTPIESFGMTLLPPESLHFGYLARRAPSGQWTLYLLSAADSRASRLVALGKDSYVNRALAIFGHVAQVPAATERR